MRTFPSASCSRAALRPASMVRVQVEASPFRNHNLSAIFMRSSVVNRTMQRLVTAIPLQYVRCEHYEVALGPFLRGREWFALKAAHAAFQRGEIAGPALIPLYRHLVRAGLMRHLVLKKAMMLLSRTFPLARCVSDERERAALCAGDDAQMALVSAILLRAKELPAARLFATMPAARRPEALRVLHRQGEPVALRAERAALFYFNRLCAMSECQPRIQAERALILWDAALRQPDMPLWMDDSVSVDVAVPSTAVAGGPRPMMTAETFMKTMHLLGTLLAFYYAVGMAFARKEAGMDVPPDIAEAMDWLLLEAPCTTAPSAG